MKTLRMLFGVASMAAVALAVTAPAMPARADIGQCKDSCLNDGVACETACATKCEGPGRLGCLRDCTATCQEVRRSCARTCDGN